jgi:hypothetical protein
LLLAEAEAEALEVVEQVEFLLLLLLLHRGLLTQSLLVEVEQVDLLVMEHKVQMEQIQQHLG